MNFREVNVPLGGSHRPKANGLVVQRRCACGNHVRGGECEACRRKKAVHRMDRGTADPVARSLGTRTTDGGSPAFGTDLSGVAAPGAAAAPRLRTAQRVQRQPAGTPPVAEPAPAPEAAPEPAATAPAESLIVDDDAVELQPGQMRKTEFLDQLQRTVCAEVDAALAASGRDTRGCPYLAGWFRFYRGQGAAHVEAALRRYAPEARGARSAAGYVPLVAARVHQGVARWAETGEITGVPEGVPLTPAGSLAALGGAVGAIGSAVGGLMFKERDGGAHRDDDPAAVQRSLGSGRPLESGVRGRMERVFGRSFAHVRAHTDANAASINQDQHARALAVGRHVAFGAGQYRPGTPVGDALIAHELAHTIQQGSDPARAAAGADQGGNYRSLEADADRSAAGAVVALFGKGLNVLEGAAGHVLPSMQSGLRLQRCDLFGSKEEEKGGPTRQAEPKEQAPEEEPADAALAPQPGEAPERPGDAAAEPVPAVSEEDRKKRCTATVDPDRMILSHTAAPRVIQTPGDTVTFKVEFACIARGGGYSKFLDAGGSEFGRTSFSPERNEFTRTWDGKKLFDKVGTYLVDDGVYRHRIEPFKYTYRAGKDVLTAADSDSPTIKVKAREYTGPGTEHFHYSAANAAALAKAIETEMGGENDTAKRAVAWAIRNQMIRLNTSDTTRAMTHFRVRSEKEASAASLALAEEILKKPMSGDTTGGAIKWFSPNAQPPEEKPCKGEGCGGGVDTFTDTSGTQRRRHTPAFHKHMTYVPIAGIHEWRVRFYKL